MLALGSIVVTKAFPLILASWNSVIFIVNTYVIYFIHKIFTNGQSLVGGLGKNSLSLFSLIEKIYKKNHQLISIMKQ